MIYSVSGRVTKKGDHFAVIDLSGLGFKVFASSRTLSGLVVGAEVSLFCHPFFREENLALYGFLSEDELAFFELLISVGGVGPKSGLSILEIASIQDLKSAIKEGRADLLTRASGIGSKTAERIVLELKTKVALKDSESTVKKMESDADIMEILSELGYRKDQAKSALEKVGTSTVLLEARLKAALKILNTKEAK